jgi:hypothetical protein
MPLLALSPKRSEPGIDLCTSKCAITLVSIHSTPDLLRIESHLEALSQSAYYGFNLSHTLYLCPRLLLLLSLHSTSGFIMFKHCSCQFDLQIFRARYVFPVSHRNALSYPFRGPWFSHALWGHELFQRCRALYPYGVIKIPPQTELPDFRCNTARRGCVALAFIYILLLLSPSRPQSPSSAGSLPPTASLSSLSLSTPVHSQQPRLAYELSRSDTLLQHLKSTRS